MPDRRLPLVFRPTLVFAALCFLSLALWSCAKEDSNDVSNDPGHGNFTTVVGTWKTKVPMYLKQGETRLWLAADDANYGGNPVVAQLPVGTEISVDRLIEIDSVQATVYYVAGKVMSGQHEGRDVALDRGLFVNNAIIGRHPGPYPLGKNGWAVASDKLEK